MTLKQGIKVLALMLTIASAGTAHAGVLFTSTYTADNFVESFSLSGGGQTLDMGSKLFDWRYPTTSASVALQEGTEYTATWKVINVSLSASDTSYTGSAPIAAGGTNPMAFLGTITVAGTTYASSANSIWKIDGLIPMQYSSAPNIWSNNGLQTPGVYGLAAWIGSGADGADADGRFTVTAKFTTPSKTPIPAAAWLLGSGLIGLGAFRKRMFG